MKALVMAGGRGGNMIPFSETRPNPMIPVGGKHVIDHILQTLKSAGVNHVTTVIGHQKDKLRDHLTASQPTGMSVHFIDQGKPDGIGKAILKAKGKFAPGDNFLLVYADTLTTSNIFNVTIQSFSLHNEPTAAICLTSASEKYGNVYLGQDAKITKIIEKPSKSEGLGNYVLAGVFVLPARFFDYLSNAGGDMEKALQALIKKETLRASIWEDEWLDMAYPWDILTANKAIMDTWKEASIHESVELSGASLKGPVRIAEGVQIMQGAALEGPSYIGPGTYIGHNALIRPYTCIGGGSVIGHGVELKNCVIFPGATVGRLCFIGDSVIGENVNIGAGTMTINQPIDKKGARVKIKGKALDTELKKLGAFIGDNAVIGASNTLAAGTVVDAGRVIDHNLSVK
ncbi:MAG: NTP transferase domain-containing protein [Nitrospinae bacterium]|nr:NTP transferase domain-containing protein [Nitrospinota bacterium]